MNPDPYRGPFGADGKLYANDLANLLESATSGRIAGFFHETIQVSYCHSALSSYSYLLIFKDVDPSQLECNLGKLV